MFLDRDTTYSWHEKNINIYVFSFYYKKFDDIYDKAAKIREVKF